MALTMKRFLSTDRDKRDTQLKIWNGAKTTGLFVVMTLLAIVLLFPYIFMVNKSLMSSAMIINPDVQFFPDWGDLRFVNYYLLFNPTNTGVTIDFGWALMWSFITVATNCIVVPISASLAAYSFAKLRWKGRNVVFACMMLTIMLPGTATQIPLYVMYARLGWLNTIMPFTIPNLFGGGALYIFLIRQYMMGIPNELIDAARVDGCGAFRTYIQIIMPNCKTILLYIAIQVFMTYWGDYYGPLVYMTTASGHQAQYNFAYALFQSSVEGAAATEYGGVRMAGGVFMTLFPAIIFTIFQKQLTNGDITSGLKG